MLHWFETELLTGEKNVVGLMAVNRDLIERAETFDHADRVVLDMDSSESPVHGQQEGSAYNGHFETVCYHRCSCSTITATASPCCRNGSTLGRRPASSSLVKTGGATGQARPVLLAPGGESPDPPPVRVDAPADLGAARPDWLTVDGGPQTVRAKSGRNTGEVSADCERAASSSAGIQIAMAGVLRCDRGDKKIRPGEVE
jgi:hypothetical protein